MYGEGGVVEGNGRFHQPACACAQHPPTSDQAWMRGRSAPRRALARSCARQRAPRRL